MGASLGREGAPKQAGAVIANVLSDKAALSDEQRRLLVACGAGAGMAAAYGVPLGGALFALEVLRGMLALRLVLPALSDNCNGNRICCSAGRADLYHCWLR
jgi:H+/Cl- antiporter ClcA